MDNLRRAGLTVLIISGIALIASLVMALYIPEKASSEAVEPQTTQIAVDIGQNTAQATFDDLLDAIEWVESRGDANAVGDWTKWKEIPFDPDGGLTITGDDMFITQLRNINGKNVRRDAQAVGAYQIHKIYVDDVNRICKLNGYYQPAGHYVYSDRWDRYCSRFMVEIYIKHYYQQVKLCDTVDGIVNGNLTPYEIAARIHNGGPNGWKKESTKKYWLKIKNYLDNLQ